MNEKGTLKRYKEARARREQWQGLLEEAYGYALPEHRPMREGDQTKGQNERAHVFDATAPLAVADRRAKMHGQMFPPFREWMDFARPEGVEDEAFAEWAEMARERFHAAIEASNFHIEINPSLGDALVSTGALAARPGTLDNPLKFEAICSDQLVVEEGLDGILDTKFRRWKLTARQFEARWPDADLPVEEEQAARQDPEYKIEVVEAFIGDDGDTRYELWSEKGDGKLMLEDQFRSHPLIAFRMDKAPGEWMGRGPVIQTLPDIKTANKVVELILKNASIAVTGIWQAEDDGVLNPANIRLTPGTIIPKAVGSAGLTPLEAPGRFDVSQIVLASLQENIRRAIMGPSLPPADEAGRTAFEIDVRRQEQQAVDLPMSLRLLSELVYPLAGRVLAILSSPQMIGSEFYIKPLDPERPEVRPRPVSPLTRLQDVADAGESYQAFAAAMQIAPDMVPGLVDRAGYLSKFLTDNGFKPEHLQTEEKRAEFEAMVRLKMVELQAQERLAQQQEAA